jgi:O-antigen/teichoic acid export membrane protein
MAVADIGKKDFVWTLIATLFKIGAGVLLFPFVLRMLPAATVGIWTIFTVITQLTFIFDFGFNASFARNVSYVFSGVRTLKKEGYESVTPNSCDNVDYKLLGATIKSMRFFYSRMALIFFLLLATLGTFYIYTLMQNYTGDVREVYVSWIILVILNSYNLYTLYYESLLNGRGLIKSAHQIIFIGNFVYLAFAIVLILLGGGLVAIVLSQAMSVFLVRFLSRRVFFTKDICSNLALVDASDYKDVLSAITPNAIKVGLTSLGGFVINKSSMFIGSLYVSLELMASYGITIQILAVVGMLGGIITRVYLPKVFQWRVEERIDLVKKTFYFSSIAMFVVFFTFGLVIFLWGDLMLNILKSNTILLPAGLLLLMFIQHYLEYNHSNAAQYLLSRNEVPFFKASLISACAVFILLILFVVYFDMGVLGMILAPMLVQAAYQNWKWPLEVIKEFRNKI